MKSKANTTESDLITDGELVSGKHGRDYVATEEKNYGWVLNITFKAEKKTYKDYVCQLHTDGVVESIDITATTLSSPIVNVKERKKSRKSAL